MPKYIVSSEGPISVREVNKPEWERPDWRPETGLPGVPDTGGPGRPPWADWEVPPIPPRDEWPPLPPGLGDDLRDRWAERFPPSPGLPIPPTPEFPMVPVEPDPDVPEIWPPIRPDFPDLSGKTLALALVYVSRRVARWHWVIIDHQEVKDKIKKIKDKLPAGGIGGRPPARPEPGRG